MNAINQNLLQVPQASALLRNSFPNLSQGIELTNLQRSRSFQDLGERRNQPPPIMGGNVFININAEKIEVKQSITVNEQNPTWEAIK